MASGKQLLLVLLLALLLVLGTTAAGWMGPQRTGHAAEMVEMTEAEWAGALARVIRLPGLKAAVAAMSLRQQLLAWLPAKARSSKGSK